MMLIFKIVVIVGTAVVLAGCDYSSDTSAEEVRCDHNLFIPCLHSLLYGQSSLREPAFVESADCACTGTIN